MYYGFYVFDNVITPLQMERFRNRVIQVTFSTPNIKAPEKEISDDELLESLKSLIDERTDMTRKVQDMNEQLNHAISTRGETVESSKKLKQQMNETVVSVMPNYLATVVINVLK